MFLWIVLPLLLAVLFAVALRRQRTKRPVVFVGPRATGKTRTLLKVCGNENVQTVPTLRGFSMRRGNVEISEQPPEMDRRDECERYGMHSSHARYVFFLKAGQQIPETRDFDVTFVHFGPKENGCDQWKGVSRGVLFLENDPEKIVSVL